MCRSSLSRSSDSDTDSDTDSGGEFAGFSSPARIEVLAALCEDSALRVPGVTAGLYGLDELAPFARLGYGIPLLRHTLHWKRRLPVRFSRAANDAKFGRRLLRAAPYLASFDLKRYGLCLAGGAVSALLMRSDGERRRNPWVYHDYDLFLVGHQSYESAKAAIQALRCHLYAQWGGEGRVEVYRSQGCITFYSRDPRAPVAETPEPPSDEYEAGLEALYGVDRRPLEAPFLVQVVLRRYSTAAEVVHGFDLGSSAALWDGQRVRVTALGKLAFEHGANVLNLAARRNSYERRLARYFGRGFDLVLPDLSGLALLKSKGRLPYLHANTLKCYGGCACDLWASEVYATRPENDDYGRAPSSPAWGMPPAELSDYAMGSIAYGDKLQVELRNVRALGGAQVWADSLCARAPLTSELDIFGIEPELDADNLTDLALRAFGGESVNLKTLDTCLGTEVAADLALLYLGGRGKAPAREIVHAMAERRCAALSARATIPFAFMAVKDRTALTTPYASCSVSTQQWYGKAWNGEA